MHGVTIKIKIYIIDTKFDKRKNIKNIQNKHRIPNNKE